MTAYPVPRLNQSGRIDPNGAPLHDSLQGREGHVPSSAGQSPGLMPQTNGDGSWSLIPAPSPDPATSAGRVLGVTRYAPTTEVDLTPANAVGGADYDPAVLAVSFTVPDSGRVIVELEATHLTSAAAQVFWMLRQQGVAVANSRTPVNAATTPGRGRATIVVDGLTPGQAVTWTWAVAANSGANTSTIRALGGNTALTAGAGGAAIMMVKDAPF